MIEGFELTKEQKDQAIVHIKNYFDENRDEAIGDLAALLFLDFICDMFGPFFYNLGIADSAKFMTDKIDDLFSIEK